MWVYWTYHNWQRKCERSRQDNVRSFSFWGHHKIYSSHRTIKTKVFLNYPFPLSLCLCHPPPFSLIPLAPKISSGEGAPAVLPLPPLFSFPFLPLPSFYSLSFPPLLFFFLSLTLPLPVFGGEGDRVTAPGLHTVFRLLQPLFKKMAVTVT